MPSPLAGPLLRVYGKAYGVNLNEAEPQADGYPTFDAYFTRTLRPGARDISGDAVVSPADGRVSASGRIDPGSRLFVKGQSYEVAELTGEPSDATRYINGEFAVVYLAPGDYHRVHSPVDGEVTSVRKIEGDLYTVNRIGEEHVPKLFVRNKRVSIVVETKGLGRVTVVMVGAMIVGRITVTGIPEADVPAGLHPFPAPRPVARGDELGIFHLGSTVVLLLEPGISVVRQLGKIRYGDSLLRTA
jgi:phosphatidylserine decarboxylase